MNDERISRRKMIGQIGLVAAGTAIGCAASREAEAAPVNRSRALNVIDLGAKGDGKADDTRAIQSAINAAAVLGGLVYFPPGTYISGTLTLKSKVHIVGVGYEATIIKLKNDTNASLFVGQNFATLTGTNGTGGIAQWSMSDLTIDGNRANNTAGSGIKVYAYGYTLRNLRIRDCDDEGIYSEWSTNPDSPSPAYDGMEAHVENVKVHNCSGNGITWAGPHDSNWVGVFVYACGLHGVHLRPGGMLRATMCHVYAVGLVPWYLEAEAKCYNCIAEGANGSATNPQVFIGTNDCMWIGGLVTGPDVGKVGIQIGDATHPAAMCIVDTIILNTATAVSVVNDGGQNDVRARVWTYTTLLGGGGAPSTNSVYDLRTVDNRGSGVTTPAVPASLTSIRNDLGVDATVYIKGGTVTEIYVNGLPIGMTSGAVRLPAYHQISLNYSVAPTWKWVGG